MSQSEQVGIHKSVVVGNSFSITAGDEFCVTVGKSSLVMKSDGSVLINGSTSAGSLEHRFEKQGPHADPRQAQRDVSAE